MRHFLQTKSNRRLTQTRIGSEVAKVGFDRGILEIESYFADIGYFLVAYAVAIDDNTVIFVILFDRDLDFLKMDLKRARNNFDAVAVLRRYPTLMKLIEEGILRDDFSDIDDGMEKYALGLPVQVADVSNPHSWLTGDGLETLNALRLLGVQLAAEIEDRTTITL